LEVIIDRLTESAHFIPVNTNYNVQKYAEIYVARVLYLHGVLKTIISDRGSQFIARFWEQLHASLGTHLIHSSAYHPQMDGQNERVNQILEDMLRACVMEYPGSWDKNLSWAEFSYNNSYQESLKMAPLKHYMDDQAAPRSTGSSQERKLYLAQTLLLRLKQRYIVFKKT
jgi:transposase InsO family protein